MNYQAEMEKIIAAHAFRGEKPRLFLHVCCAPCASYVFSALKESFYITAFYYNPNISPKTEHDKRAAEVERLIAKSGGGIEFIRGEYEPERFSDAVRGMESLPEGGERCFSCYELRLLKTAREAKKRGADYFCTTLSISPHKNAEKLNAIGSKAGEKFGVKFLPSDFKKKDGFKISTILSAKYSLYRQDYCGCAYSKKEREMDKLIEKCIKAGADKAGIIDVSKIKFDPSLRVNCEANYCGLYGRNHGCPPEIGGADELIKRAKKYSHMLVFQTISPLEDSFDYEGMQAAVKKHHELTFRLRDELQNEFSNCLMLGAGGCEFCEKCARETDEPCRFPDKMVASMEAYCVNVSTVAPLAGMNYINGENTVTYFSGFLF